MAVTKEQLKLVSQRFVSLMEAIASMTETTADDRIVLVLQAIQERELLLDWFFTWLTKTSGPPGTFSVRQIPSHIMQEFEEAGLTQNDVQEFLKMRSQIRVPMRMRANLRDRPILTKFVEMVGPILIAWLTNWLTGGLPTPVKAPKLKVKSTKAQKKAVEEAMKRGAKGSKPKKSTKKKRPTDSSVNSGMRRKTRRS